MLNYRTNFALCATKKNNIPTLVLSGNFFLNETKNHKPSCKLNGRSLKYQVMNIPAKCDHCLFQSYLGGKLLVNEIRVHSENHRPVAIHLQT